MKLLGIETDSAGGGFWTCGWVAPDRVPELLRMTVARLANEKPASGVAIIIRVSP